jgi:transposase-like protein
MEKVQCRRHFSRDEKQRILDEHRHQKIAISELARKYKINAITIYQWKRTMAEETKNPYLKNTVEDLLAQIRDLKKEAVQKDKVISKLSVSVEILNEALEISKKREILNQLSSPKKSKKIPGMR